MAIGLMLPLLADDRFTRTLSSTQTAHFQVAATGIIRLENSFGEVDIEGWDRPEIDVTVVRSTEHSYPAQDPVAQRRLDSVQVATRQDGNDVVITTSYPPRSVFLHPLSRRSDVEIRYEIYAPRASKLIVQHNRGGVNVTGVRGDIHATLTNGQIGLTLIPGSYAIDAESKIGQVYSDFEGHGGSRHWIGDQFTGSSASPSANLYLRVRYGDILILKQTGPAD